MHRTVEATLAVHAMTCVLKALRAFLVGNYPQGSLTFAPSMQR